MKKFIALVLVFVSVLSFTACKNNTPTDPTTPDSTGPQETEPQETEPLETEPQITEALTTEHQDNDPLVNDHDFLALINQLYEVQPIDFDVFNNDVDIEDTDNLKYYTGLDDPDMLVKATVSEGAMTTTAYSVVLMQVNPAFETSAVADAVIEGIDPFKWICVGAEDVQLVTKGDVIMLVMTPADFDISSDDIINAFVEIFGTADLELKK